MTILLIFAADKSKAKAKVSPFRFDRYSGITVMNTGHAESVIMTRHANAPMVGETAPDSEMITAKSGKVVSLHSILKKKPMVLLFGSSSCSNLDSYLPNIADLCERFGDRVDFTFVYIREAHPEGGFMPNLNQNGVDISKPPLPDPKTLKERRKSAQELKGRTSPRLQIFVDSIDDEMAVRWGAWPVRVFVVGPDRKLMYSGGPGPFHFQFSKGGWHSQPPPHMENEFNRMPFSRKSLEEFLESIP
ncbi:MAG: hypothetical protein KDN20_00965 [Verrucomicrobiae bacterium]|nr:hypothetical protein [Verrucomicrobiae bacterium]